MKKIKLYQLIILFAVPIWIAGCTKKQKKPFGENVMTVKINGQEFIAKGNSTSFGIEGTKQNLSGDNRSLAGYFDAKLNLHLSKLPLLNEIGSYRLDAQDTIMKKTIAVVRKNSAYKSITYVNRVNGGQVNITNNSSAFISGTFNCTVYQDTTGLRPHDASSPDSLVITEGYFDVPVH
jgi:hypothetical protein